MDSAASTCVCGHPADWHSHEGTGDCEHDADCECPRFDCEPGASKPLRFYVRDVTSGARVDAGRGRRGFAWSFDARRWIDGQERPQEFDVVQVDWEGHVR